RKRGGPTIAVWTWLCCRLRQCVASQDLRRYPESVARHAAYMGMGMRASFHRLALPLFCAAALNAARGGGPAGNQFAWTAYRDLAQGKKNLIFSPFSISTALSMVLQGARGRTAEEISSVLHQMPADSLASLMADLEKSANTGGNQLKTANRVWVQS